MARKIVHILIILFYLSGVAARAQHPYYYTLHDDNGLLSNEVYQLYQDDFGYMWMGCNSGLFRYDGFKFTQFKNTHQNSIAISGLCLPEGKRLYCQNFTGRIFYVNDDSLVLCADVKEHIRTHPAYTIDENNNAWIGLPGGLLKHDTNGHENLLFRDELHIIEIDPSPDGSLYAVDMTKGLLKIDVNINSGYSWKRIPGISEPFNNSRTTIKKYGDRFFALSATNAERNYYISEIVRDSVFLIKKIDANSLAEFIYSLTCINNKFWLGTSSGAYCMNAKGEIENHFFQTEKISDIMMDREGNYWFSSLQNGIFIIPDLDIESITTSNSAIEDNNITSLKATSANDLFVGTYSGDAYHYSISGNKLEKLPKSRTAVYRNVTAILPYDEENIIVSRGAVSVINLKNKTDRSYPSIYIRDMVQTGDSIIFVSSEMAGSIPGISALVNNHEYHSTNIKYSAGKYVSADKTTGTVWISLNSGLTSYEQGKFTPYLISSEPLFCNALYSDMYGLWAGTISDGVYNIRNKKVVLHLNNTNGLLGSNVRSIIAAHDTQYIATDECVNIRYPNGSFAYLDYTEGINAKEITSLALAGNHLFIGTIRGLFHLPVSTRLTNNVKPHIRIVSVFVNGKEEVNKKLVILPWNNTDMLINFSAIALRSRGKFHYQYRIKGLRDNWVRLDGNINYVRLNHLPPGNFTFEVKAVNEDGATSAYTATIAIIAQTPFWHQWWFYAFIFIFGSSLVTLLFITRIRKIKQAANVRNQLTTSQLTALKAQMNPHFMYNTLNSIQDLVLQNDIKNTNYYLSRYSTLMRKILDSSENNEIDIAEEVEILQLYMELEKLRFGDDFIHSIVVSEKIEGKEISIPSMIIQPFVENAIKHGLLHKKGEKRLEVIFDETGQNLVCTIKDNGIGRKKAAEIQKRSQITHRSFATTATKRRLELVNLDRKHKIKLEIKDLEVNGMDAGTEVRLEIPIE